MNTRVPVSLHLPHLNASLSDIEWIAFLSKKGDRYRLFETVFSADDLAGLDLTEALNQQVNLKKLPPEAELFLAIHFKSLSAPTVLAPPRISWTPPGVMGLLDVQFTNRRLHVAGWARDAQFLRLPTRVELTVDGEVVSTELARQEPSEELAEHVPAVSYLFNVSTTLPLFDDDTPPDIRVRLKDFEHSIAVQLDQPPEETPPAPVPTVSPDHTILGKIERVSKTEVVGWAVDADEPDAPVDLILHLDDRTFSHSVTSISRPDVQTIHGGTGFAGFRFELPANLALASSSNLKIAPLVGQNRIRHAIAHIKPTGKVLLPSETQVDRVAKAARSYKDLPVSIIVLNRNCAPLLEDLFRSAAEHEDLSMIEWIIIDHNSTDNYEDICEQASAQGHVIRIVKRNGNFSFSDSNNLGARLASHDTLIFANNDLIFQGPFRKAILRALAQSDVGMVGVSLYDYFSPELPVDPETAPLQHMGVYFNTGTTGTRWFRPYEARLCPETSEHLGKLINVPAVTGAFMAMQRDDFNAVSGFDEGYIYGLEDVDLCLKVSQNLNKSIVVNNSLRIIHHRGFSRSKEKNVAVRQRNNNNLFNKVWGNHLRNQIKHDVLRRPGYWTGGRPVVGFIVADAGDKTTAGEYYTALELGRALQDIAPVHLRFLTRDDWYDLSGIDILIVMVQGFNLNKVKKASPFLITINWTRQWFDRWAKDESIHSYDFIFASSQPAADFLAAETGRDVAVLPIATHYDHFSTAGQKTEKYECHYCLTGNWVGTPRAIEYQLVPEAINGTGAIYGANWESTPLSNLSRGPVAYSDIVHVYASTKIVIDDANIATKDWGSCNSRVFDALAAGCLLITNGELGVRELFGDLVPTFSDAISLTQTLNEWLEDDSAREARIKELQEVVRTEHNYSNRARTVHTALSTGQLAPRVAIKIAARYAERQNWGDYHFAESLAVSLRKLGFLVTVDCLESWDRGTAESDDVVLVLRGLKGYNPRPNQHNILWLISHPRDIPLSEIEKFDQVYVASQLHCERLREMATVPVDPLLQCTDPTRFKPTETADVAGKMGKPIFVGNSRGVFRTVVKWGIELELDFDVYGNGWEQFVTDERLRSTLIPNEVLSDYYERSTAVLCDHWDDMKRDGFLSNRAFDVLACGGQLVVDDVVGIEDILPGGYRVFHNREELGEILNSLEVAPLEERLERVEWVRENHSFDARAQTLAEWIRAALAPAEAKPAQTEPESRKTA